MNQLWESAAAPISTQKDLLDDVLNPLPAVMLIDDDRKPLVLCFVVQLSDNGPIAVTTPPCLEDFLTSSGTCAKPLSALSDQATDNGELPTLDQCLSMEQAFGRLLRFEYSHYLDARRVRAPKADILLVSFLDLLIKIRRAPEPAGKDDVRNLLIRSVRLQLQKPFVDERKDLVDLLVEDLCYR